MADIIKLPTLEEPSEADRIIDHLFQALPANDHKEIARRISKSIGRKISRGYLGSLISHLRANSHKYGWTIPHAQRGKQGKDKKGPRFFHVLVERGRDPQFDKHHEQNLNDGVFSTISLVATSMRNQADAISMSINYLKSPTAKQMARHMARQQKRLSEDAELLVEMVRQENGSAA